MKTDWTKPFEQNVELDALLLHAAFSGGFSKFMFSALSLGVPSPDEAVARGEFLKEQPQAYKEQVIARVKTLLDGPPCQYRDAKGG